MRNYNNEIIEYFNDEENVKLCSNPTTAFITFEYEEARRMALHMSEKQAEFPDILKYKLLGQVIDFKQAPEPSDIIWENRCLS
jgi:hypothetical protein